LISQKSVDQRSKRWDVANRFKVIYPFYYVVDMLKEKNVVAISKCDFYRLSLERGRGLELVSARPEQGWFL
jgi:hypothetical protein